MVTVPTGVRSINIHCTGGGSGGLRPNPDGSDSAGGGGGGGGYTAYKNSISTYPGQTVQIVVGTGSNYGTGNPGSPSTASLNGTIVVSANGGAGASNPSVRQGRDGGSGGGRGAWLYSETSGSDGGSDGSNGKTWAAGVGIGQGSSTKEFGTGTLYSGGGGGGGAYHTNASFTGLSGAGGAGGGGAGGSVRPISPGANGSAGLGGGGGGSGIRTTAVGGGGNGGSGNVIITW